MEKVKVAAVAVLRFIGTTLLIDLALFAVVSISCLIGTRCTNEGRHACSAELA